MTSGRSGVASSSKTEKPKGEEVVESSATTAPTSNCTSDPGLFDEDEEEVSADFDDVDDKVDAEVPTKDQRQLYAIGGGAYNALKTFNGQVYSGMAVGGSHTWNYDQGLWKETKVEPDRWEIDYKTTKRRARKAPKGSGVPVGAQYHWFIVAHQYVEKSDENTYETHLVGSKYKLAHKSTSASSWSVPTVKAQRERELELLDDAKRRVQGLPPVLASEKAKSRKQEKGQQTLDTLFKKRGGSGKTEDVLRKKRKVETE